MPLPSLAEIVAAQGSAWTTHALGASPFASGSGERPAYGSTRVTLR